VVTLREVVGDPDELRALQRTMESDEGFAVGVTGHPPGPADAQSTLMFVPEARSPTTRRPSASGPTTSSSGSSTCRSATPTRRSSTSACSWSTVPGRARGSAPPPARPWTARWRPAGRGPGACASAWSAPTTRCLGSGAGWASPRPARFAPTVTTSSSPRCPDGQARGRRRLTGRAHRPAWRRSRTAWRSGGRGSVRSIRVPVAGWVKARRQAWRKGRGTPRRVARVGSAP
jgi:hypothetical protein